MIKKIIITLLLINTYLFSGDINLRSIQAHYSNLGSVEIVISAQDENAGGFPNKNSKDWVGIYSKGASNAWENVKTWSWVKDFGAVKDGDAVNIIGVNLQAGNYEVRYFRNNSFTTYKKSSFKVENAGDINLRSIKAKYFVAGSLVITITAQDKNAGGFPNRNSKDWVALYKKDSSNAWGNVIEWAWVKDFGNVKNGEATFSIQKHLRGKYEVRYFRNNSFTTYKSYSFTIGTDNLTLESIGAEYKNKTLYVGVRHAFFDPLNNAPKDWVGVYRKGSSNAWGNVLAWFWAKDFEPEDIGYDIHNIKNINLKAGEYEVKYFRNNSFTTYKKSSFKVK